MARFIHDQTLSEFQLLINQIYALPDDRLYSLFDLLTNQQRFTMRAIKGIRKGDHKKLKTNLLISISWLMAMANRLHINMEEVTWRRFPLICSYCGKKPCICKSIKSHKRIKIIRRNSLKPESLEGFQIMFDQIYPANSRTLADAGVHLAEEMGELTEAIHIYMGEHHLPQFKDIENEAADYLSCLFGVANSAKIDMAGELESFFYKNCHVCHDLPCSCNFSFVSKFRS